MAGEAEDDELTLSPYALAALAEFNAEKDAHQEHFSRLQREAEERASAGGPISMSSFAEDWNESQFWYSDETSAALAEALLLGVVDVVDSVVVVSAPSAFVALRNMIIQPQYKGPKPKLTLLEHDSRFSVFSEFVFYDFNQPLKLPASLKGSASRIICDPPFLSEDCQTKAALTVKWLAKPDARLVVCTGERMETLVNKLYRSLGLRTTSFEPHHARGLSNEFCCFSNFDCSKWKLKGGDGCS